MAARVLFLLIAVPGLIVGGFGAGCSRTEPHALVVDAANPRRLASWRENVFERFKPADWREFDDALQEIRQRVTAEHEASGSEAVEQAMCRRIQGRMFRQVLVLGYEAKLARLDPSRAELKKAIDGNALLVSKPGDTSSARYLEGLRDRQEERVRKLDAEIEAAEKRLVELSPAKWSDEAVARKKSRSGPISPPSLSREKALSEIKTLIDEQRSAVLLKYGDWPAKLVTDESALPEPERSEVVARRRAAATAGNTVIAVHVRGRWWIYDDKPELPIFSRSVTANLSELDRANLESTWANWQAELWARRRADEESRK